MTQPTVDIAELRRLDAAAPKAPWESCPYSGLVRNGGVVRSRVLCHVVRNAVGKRLGSNVVCNINTDFLPELVEGATDLIVVARNALPSLLDALDAKDKDIETMLGLLRDVQAHRGMRLTGRLSHRVDDTLAKYDAAKQESGT